MCGHSIRLLVASGLVGGFLSLPAQAGAPDVVASIKPVHSLVAALMDGVAEPTLLLRSGGSPHSYALRPSDARALQQADIVVWIGGDLEIFLERPLGTLAADARIVTLIEADGLSLLPSRESGAWEAHGHGGEKIPGEAASATEGPGEIDMHLWLDPRNAAAMARTLAAVLIDSDPQNAANYQANAARVDADLAALERALDDRLESVRERPFVVFHDAYQYFERRFEVNAVGSITVSPERQPGAARLRELRQAIMATQAHCVFSEPQFEPRLLETVLEGTDARSGVLDPLGAELAAGPELYFRLMWAMADSLVDCLGGQDAG